MLKMMKMVMMTAVLKPELTTTKGRQNYVRNPKNPLKAHQKTLTLYKYNNSFYAPIF